MEAVGDVALCCEADHRIHHVAATSHDEADVLCALQDLRCGFDEVLTALLHRDTSEEGDDLVADTSAVGECEDRGCQWRDRIVHGRDLGWILVILLDDGTAGEIADGDDVVSVVHPVHLDTEYRGVHIATTAVEVRGVDVYDEGLTGDLLGMDPRWISQPVV